MMARRPRRQTLSPPPGFIAYVNGVLDFRLALEESSSRLKTWGPYGVAAHPFVRHEMVTMRDALDRAIVVFDAHAKEFPAPKVPNPVEEFIKDPKKWLRDQHIHLPKPNEP